MGLHSGGLQSGGNSLGANNLQLPISGQENHSAAGGLQSGALQYGGLQSGGQQSPTTDSGPGIALTRSKEQKFTEGNLLSTLGLPPAKMQKQVHKKNPGKTPKPYEIHIPNSDWIFSDVSWENGEVPWASPLQKF